jgi:hypothetical protein
MVFRIDASKVENITMKHISELFANIARYKLMAKNTAPSSIKNALIRRFDLRRGKPLVNISNNSLVTNDPPIKNKPK